MTIAGLGTVTKIIIGVGGLAAAIAAVLGLVLSLLPKGAPHNIARFVSVQGLAQVPISQFPQRSVVFNL